MLKKLGLLSLVCFMAVGGQKANAQTAPAETKTPQALQQNQVVRPRLKMPNSIIVCRAKQCAPAKLSMAKEYIYNTLLHMFDSNARQKALICAGNHNTHACTEEFVSIPITVGVTPAYLYLDDVKIADVSISQQNTMALNLLLNWGVSYNGQTPVCRPSKTLLYVKNIDNVIMEDGGYTCKMTTVGTTTISTMFAIDYIDLDFGFIGGYYSIGLSGPAFGGASGYMIIRLPNDISIEAADFQVKPEKDDPDEETVVERVFSETTVNNETIEMEEETKPTEPILKPIEEETSVKTENSVSPQPVVPQPAVREPVAVQPAVTPPAAMSGQYLYDADSGEYIPLQVQSNPQSAEQQYVPVQNPFQVQSNPQIVEQQYVPVQEPFQVQSNPQIVEQQYVPVQNPFQVPAPGAQPLTTVPQNYVPVAVPTTQEITLAPAYAPAQAYPPVMQEPQYIPTAPQNPQMQPYGQYIYDSFSGRYIPLPPQYQFDPATGNYIQANYPEQTQAPAPVKEKRKAAPNVDTIIKYHHPARQYEEAKAAAAAEAERVKKETARQRKEARRRKKMEEEATEFSGVKVFPVPTSNLDKYKDEPKDKNSLSDYVNPQESRRFQ